MNLSNDDVVYMTAEIEEGNTIAQGNAPVNDDGSFVRNRVKARLGADFPIVAPRNFSLWTWLPYRLPL